MLAILLQFNDLFQLSIVVNFKLIRTDPLTQPNVIYLSTLPIFFSMKHISIDEIPVVALQLSFRTQT